MGVLQMLKEFYVLIISRSYDYDTFEFENYPKDSEIMDILKQQTEGSKARVERRYMLVNEK